MNFGDCCNSQALRRLLLEAQQLHQDQDQHPFPTLPSPKSPLLRSRVIILPCDLLTSLRILSSHHLRTTAAKADTKLQTLQLDHLFREQIPHSTYQIKPSNTCTQKLSLKYSRNNWTRLEFFQFLRKSSSSFASCLGGL